jgi:hypothetical protein
VSKVNTPSLPVEATVVPPLTPTSATAERTFLGLLESTWRLIYYVAVTVSVLIAAGALSFQYFQARSEAIAKQIEEWQGTIVFKIVQSAKLEGIQFDDIQTRYVTEASAWNRKLPSDRLSELELRTILVSLASLGIVVVDTEGRYYCNFGVPNPRLQETFLDERAKRIALATVVAHSGQYDLATLMLEIINQTKLPPDDVRRLLAEMRTAQMLAIDGNGKFHSPFAAHPVLIQGVLPAPATPQPTPPTAEPALLPPAETTKPSAEPAPAPSVTKPPEPGSEPSVPGGPTAPKPNSTASQSSITAERQIYSRFSIPCSKSSRISSDGSSLILHSGSSGTFG